MDKKQKQLGMNPSTASHRLIKDLLFNFVIEAGHVCYRCNEPLTRETFSIEHMEAWLDSEDPVGLFFSKDNIAYSHLFCNISAAKRPLKKYKDAVEYRAVNWAKHYAKNKDDILRKKRERYHRNKRLGVV